MQNITTVHKDTVVTLNYRATWLANLTLTGALHA